MPNEKASNKENQATDDAEAVARKEAELKAAQEAKDVAKAEAGALAKANEKKDVSFYLLKCRKWRTLMKIRGARVEIKGENSIITIPTSDGLYDEKVKFLREYPGNRGKGGTEFVELSDQDSRPGGSCLLDSLLDLGKESLLNVLCDSDPKNRALSRGALMMRILEEKGSI